MKQLPPNTLEKSRIGLFLSKLVAELGYLIQHRSCFICHQSSGVLICKCCLHETKLPLFPSPGHNLLGYSPVYDNLAPPAYQSLIALGEYHGVIKGLVNQLKFGSQPLAASALVEFFDLYIGPRLRAQQVVPDALIPIPLSNRRHISRQYNQAQLLSMYLATKFDIKSIDGLKRVRYTKQQSQLDRGDRQQNIKNAFAIHEPIDVQSIAIIDDVITTGATVNEACVTLQQAYPNLNISVWCMAATLR